MICPNCGAEVADLEFCEHCGTHLRTARDSFAPTAAPSAEPLAVPQAAREEPREITPEPIQETLPETMQDAACELADDSAQSGVYQWNDIPAAGERAEPPKPRRKIAIAGGIAGAIIAIALVIAFAAPAFAPSGSDESSPTGSTAQTAETSTQQRGEAAPDDVTAPSPESPAASEQSAEDMAGAASSSASEASFDARAFDASGNPTLFALCELSGKELQKTLAAAGFVWVDGASSWMSPTGALLEIQGEKKLMAKDDIDGLKAGAGNTPAVFITMSSGYLSPEEALDGIAGEVTVKDTFVKEGDDIAFAKIRNSAKKNFLAVTTSASGGQQTTLVFTEKAIKGGLFSTLVGVDAGNSIADIWKTLKAE